MYECSFCHARKFLFVNFMVHCGWEQKLNRTNRQPTLEASQTFCGLDWYPQIVDCFPLAISPTTSSSGVNWFLDFDVLSTAQGYLRTNHTSKALLTEWMKIYRWHLTIPTQNNVCSQRQVPPQTKNTKTLGQYKPQKLTPKPKTGTMGIHSVTYILHKRFGENRTYIITIFIVNTY